MDPKGRTASCAGGCRGELGLLVHHVIIAERPHGWLGDVVWGMRDPTTALLLGRDRKSTRLNSSHSQISYAVFCLKKKNPNADHSPASTRLHFFRRRQRLTSTKY